MSLIDLRISVDAGAVTCGPCRGVWGGADRASCRIFDMLGLTQTPDRKDFERLTGCLAAQQAARPWERDEDDHDPVPHHLRGST